MTAQPNASDWTVHIGDANDANYQSLSIERIILFPLAKFRQFAYTGNAALLQLKQPIRFGETVAPISLSELNADVPIDVECVLADNGMLHVRLCWACKYLIFICFSIRSQCREQCSVHIAAGEMCGGGKFQRGNDDMCEKHESNGHSLLGMKTFHTIFFKGFFKSYFKLFCILSKQNTNGGALLCHTSRTGGWSLYGIRSDRSGSVSCGREPAVYSGISSALLKWIVGTVGNDRMIERSQSVVA